jgi:hypothetical protein
MPNRLPPELELLIFQHYFEKAKKQKKPSNQLKAMQDFLKITQSLPLWFIANDVWPDIIECHFPGERAKIPEHLTQTNLHSAYFRYYEKLHLKYFRIKVINLNNVNARYGFSVVATYGCDWRRSDIFRASTLKDPLTADDPLSRHLELLPENLKYFEERMDVFNNTDLLEEYVKQNRIEEIKFMLAHGIHATKHAITASLFPNQAASWNAPRQEPQKDSEIFKLLMANLYTQSKDSIHVRDMLFWSISWAIAKNDLEILTRLLRETKVNVNIRYQTLDDSIHIPLIMAVKKGHLPTVELLLQAGARIEIKNHKDKTAIDYAQDPKDAKILALLNKHKIHYEWQPASSTSSTTSASNSNDLKPVESLTL